jgi:hypothetical protein
MDNSKWVAHNTRWGLLAGLILGLGLAGYLVMDKYETIPPLNILIPYSLPSVVFGVALGLGSLPVIGFIRRLMIHK